MFLEVENIRKTFPDGTKALRGVNFEASKGEFVVILGLSGSGKTSLLRCINGLIKPDNGYIKLLGKTIDSKNHHNLQKNTTMVFQEFNLINNLSAINNVLTGLLDSSNKFLSLFYLFNKKQKLIALECLERVGLLEKAYSRVDNLSGGQKQRVGIARAIAKKPSLLLADEPVASLDPIIASSVLSLMKSIGKEFGITIICNLHQIELALKFSDRIIGISDGIVVFNQETNKVNKSHIKKIYGNNAHNFLEF
jgi:phosphonate transport system ATP-binding protein